MLRFSIKSLIYITAVLAALLLTFREAEHGPTLAGITGFVMYLALVGWNLYQHWNDGDVIMAEECDQEKRPE
jgi:type IV secretory pathway TrbL component